MPTLITWFFIFVVFIYLVGRGPSDFLSFSKTILDGSIAILTFYLLVKRDPTLDLSSRIGKFLDRVAFFFSHTKWTSVFSILSTLVFFFPPFDKVGHHILYSVTVSLLALSMADS